ncbi:MAG TPA: hypothetical protein VGP73_04080 [Thermoanaerobaculia bacterium]
MITAILLVSDWRREEIYSFYLSFSISPNVFSRAKKKPEETAPLAAVPLAKGVSIVNEHYCPPRERIPEVVEAVLLVRA